MAITDDTYIGRGRYVRDLPPGLRELAPSMFERGLLPMSEKGLSHTSTRKRAAASFRRQAAIDVDETNLDRARARKLFHERVYNGPESTSQEHEEAIQGGYSRLVGREADDTQRLRDRSLRASRRRAVAYA